MHSVRVFVGGGDGGWFVVLAITFSFLYLIFFLFFLTCNSPCAPKEKWYRKEHIIIIFIIIIIIIPVTHFVSSRLAALHAFFTMCASTFHVRDPLPKLKKVLVSQRKTDIQQAPVARFLTSLAGCSGAGRSYLRGRSIKKITIASASHRNKSGRIDFAKPDTKL